MTTSFPQFQSLWNSLFSVDGVTNHQSRNSIDRFLIQIYDDFANKKDSEALHHQKIAYIRKASYFYTNYLSVLTHFDENITEEAIVNFLLDDVLTLQKMASSLFDHNIQRQMDRHLINQAIKRNVHSTVISTLISNQTLEELQAIHDRSHSYWRLDDRCSLHHAAAPLQYAIMYRNIPAIQALHEKGACIVRTSLDLTHMDSETLYSKIAGHYDMEEDTLYHPILTSNINSLHLMASLLLGYDCNPYSVENAEEYYENKNAFIQKCQELGWWDDRVSTLETFAVAQIITQKDHDYWTYRKAAVDLECTPITPHLLLAVFSVLGSYQENPESNHNSVANYCWEWLQQHPNVLTELPLDAHPSFMSAWSKGNIFNDASLRNDDICDSIRDAKKRLTQIDVIAQWLPKQSWDPELLKKRIALSISKKIAEQDREYYEQDYLFFQAIYKKPGIAKTINRTRI